MIVLIRCKSTNLIRNNANIGVFFSFSGILGTEVVNVCVYCAWLSSVGRYAFFPVILDVAFWERCMVESSSSRFPYPCVEFPFPLFQHYYPCSSLEVVVFGVPA